MSHSWVAFIRAWVYISNERDNINLEFLWLIVFTYHDEGMHVLRIGRSFKRKALALILIIYSNINFTCSAIIIIQKPLIEGKELLNKNSLI